MEQLATTSEKCRLIDRLKNRKYREAYIRASINVNLPSQIRALRLALPMTQQEFALEANMKQPRISAMEKPGATKFNIETLVRLAAAFHVGLIVRFVPMSEMISWENDFSQDRFTVAPFEADIGLRDPANSDTALVNVAAGSSPSTQNEATMAAAGDNLLNMGIYPRELTSGGQGYGRPTEAATAA